MLGRGVGDVDQQLCQIVEITQSILVKSATSDLNELGFELFFHFLKPFLSSSEGFMGLGQRKRRPGEANASLLTQTQDCFAALALLLPQYKLKYKVCFEVNVHTSASNLTRPFLTARR